jgi:O-antigen ligase
MAWQSAAIAMLLVVPALVDIPSAVHAGPLSGMGVLTVIQTAIAGIGVVACGSYPRRVVIVLVPYALFLLWASVSPLWAPPTFGGAQNLFVYVLFALAVLFSGTFASRSPRGIDRTIAAAMRCVDLITLPLIAISLLTRGLPSDDNPWLMGTRSFALFALFPLSWHLARWTEGRYRSGLVAWLWVLAIGLSLSRTATAIALAYVASAFLLQFRLRPAVLLLRAPAVIGATTLVVVVLALRTPMADRLFTGDTSIEVGGVGVNASGRLSIWPLIIDSAWRAPIVGQGLGSSMEVASEIEGVGHPHNDYLRLWHDLGFVGAGAFAAAFLALAAGVIRGWRRWRSTSTRPPAATVAAALAIVGLLVACATDNALIYPFVMGPLGVLVGAALGSVPSRRSFAEDAPWVR